MDKPVFRPVISYPANTHQLRSSKPNNQNANKFSQHLKNAIEMDSKLTISKHANERMLQRGITISENRWQQIENKVQEAKKMGVKESLILLDDAALIVSARNNTVITAMDRHEAATQIFTNINGTIVME
jgi:flagellar operon protein